MLKAAGDRGGGEDHGHEQQAANQEHRREEAILSLGAVRAG